MSIRVILNDTTDITAFVKSVKRSGDSNKFNRQLDVDINATSDGRTQAISVDVGDKLALFEDGVNRFIGIIFTTDIKTDGALSVTAYDTNIYLAKSVDTRIFTNKKASEIVKILSKDFGFAIGQIDDTGYVIPYLKFAGKSLYDMVLTALTLTFKQTGKRYFVGNTGGKLTIKQGATNATRYMFSAGQNLISASYSRSIEDMATQVKVIGGAKGKETVVVAKDDAKRAKYGVLQKLETMDEKATASQVKQRANTLLKEQAVVNEQLSVEVLGVSEVDVGTPVYIASAMTKTASGYYVTNVSHSHRDGLHTMSLELSKTLELPTIEIADDVTTKEVAKTTTTKKTTAKKEEAKK